MRIHFATITKLAHGLAQLPYLPRILALVWTAARGWTLAWSGLLLIQALLPVATVYLTRAAVDSLAFMAASGGVGRELDSIWSEPILIWGALLFGAALGNECTRGAMSWVQTAQAERVQDHIRSLIHRKSMQVDLAFYDSPDSYDRLHRARDEAESRPLALIHHIGILLQYSLTLLAMGAALAPFGLWLPIALLVSTLPAFIAMIRSGMRYHQWWLRTTAEERRTWYYDWLLTAGEPAAELRLFGLGRRFQAAYQSLRQKLRIENLQLAKTQSRAEVMAGALAVGITATAYGWMIWQARQGIWTLGEIALFYQAFHQGQRFMRGILDHAGQIYSNILFLESLFDFLALQPRVIDTAKPVRIPGALRQGIGFRQVSFRYPGSRGLALDRFNLDIPAGQMVAIVGGSGAGKSTLVKLLCRLYDPDAGRIEIEGIDIRHYPLAELRQMMTVLFQSPVHYQATVTDNIGLGHGAGQAWQPTAASVRAAARAADAEAIIDRLPEGYDTMLGKRFDEGTELSGGQWQHLALARACWRQVPIILLDEPTSAMDPWSEADWMERFRTYAAARTAILITHRMTMAMRADIIHVMRHGRIVESGCHRQLLAKGEFYAQAWAAQVERGSDVSATS
nr:ABC transporter ATP-binding protein [Candidatus Entotheonella palauensis]